VFFELREYHMQLAGAGAFLADFGRDVAPMLSESGFTLLGAWVTNIGPGTHTDFVWLVQWESLDARERSFRALQSHEGWGGFMTSNKERLVGVTSRIMTALEFSPVQ
jgi:NIPSNAP